MGGEENCELHMTRTDYAYAQSAQDMRCSGLKATTRLVKLTSALFSGGLVENSSTVPLRSLVKKCFGLICLVF